MNKKKIVESLIKEGAKRVNGLTVKTVTVTQQDEWCRLGITVDGDIDGYVQNRETGIYEEAKVNTIFVSTFAIGSLLKDDVDAAFAANHLINHPEAMGMVLSHAKIDIVQEKIAEGTSGYRNPFSREDAATKDFDHDTIINHVVGIKLSEFGLKRLERLADLMMGFAA